MTKRKTPGERIAFSIDPEGTITAALWRKRIAGRIDRAIRKAQAQAWMAGLNYMHERPLDGMAHLDGSANPNDNPYRGRRK